MRRRITALVVAAVALLGVAGWFLSTTRSQSPPLAVPSLPANSVAVSGTEVTLYFADAETALLVPVQRRLEVPSADAQAVVEELIAGPKAGENLAPTLPQGTQLLGLSLSGGVVTLNLNRAFETNFPSSSAATLLTIYSLVNSLTALPGIDKVAFEIEGEAVSELGPLDVSEPLEANSDMVSKQ